MCVFWQVASKINTNEIIRRFEEKLSKVQWKIIIPSNINCLFIN